MAAKDAQSAQRVPLVAALARIALPFLVILPGLLAMSLPTPHTTVVTSMEDGAIVRTTNIVQPAAEAGRGLIAAKADPSTEKPLYDASGKPVLNYNLATPNILLHYLPAGLLGLALTALLAVLMAGLAANATAFNTIFTYDIYQPCAYKQCEDRVLLAVGRWATIGGVLLSVIASLVINRLHGGIDGVLATILMAVALLNVPVLAAYLLGIFWRRTTGHGAFCGMIAGFAVAVAHYGLSLPTDAASGLRGGWITPLLHYPNAIAQGVWTAMVAFAASLCVTVVVSLATKARKGAELKRLIYSPALHSRNAAAVWWKRPGLLAAAILLLAVALNIIFA
jgi:solute:Na+ symporter, SSS family